MIYDLLSCRIPRVGRTPEIQTLKDILKLVAATEEEPSDAAADSDAEGARGPGDDNDPGAGPAPASSAADEVVQEGAPVPGDNGQASTAAGENGQASSVAGENGQASSVAGEDGQASSVAGENGQASSEDLKEVPVAGDGEPAGTAESGVAADPSMVDTQVPMAFMQHGEEEVHEAVTSPVMVYAASRKLRPPVPAFAYEVPLTSPAPTLPEVAPQAEVRAKSFPVDPPLQESAPALAEVAEVPAAKSFPVEPPPKNRPQCSLKLRLRKFLPPSRPQAQLFLRSLRLQRHCRPKWIGDSPFQRIPRTRFRIQRKVRRHIDVKFVLFSSKDACLAIGSICR